jgi:hypothetical protein
VGAHSLPQQPHIPILNVTAILAQVHRNAICPRQLGNHRCRYRIWLHRAACLSKGGNVVDVNSKT